MGSQSAKNWILDSYPSVLVCISCVCVISPPLLICLQNLVYFFLGYSSIDLIFVRFQAGINFLTDLLLVVWTISTCVLSSHYIPVLSLIPNSFDLRHGQWFWALKFDLCSCKSSHPGTSDLVLGLLLNACLVKNRIYISSDFLAKNVERFFKIQFSGGFLVHIVNSTISVFHFILPIPGSEILELAVFYLLTWSWGIWGFWKSQACLFFLWHKSVCLVFNV